ncbi:hypothetical protein [Lonepinella sp. BR2357]|uniref:hypothetical protein n=1 Tax=Lonepinella sp. BR2357 TaxID=3434549 RepID=UPI003F6DE914
MKIVTLIILLGYIGGCSTIYQIRYMDTSFSGEHKQWKNTHYSFNDFSICKDKAKNILTDEEKKYLVILDLPKIALKQ